MGKELLFSVFPCLINVLIGNKCPFSILICLALIFSLRNCKGVWYEKLRVLLYQLWNSKRALLLFSLSFLSERKKIF